MEVAPVIVIIGLLIFLSHLFAAGFKLTKIPDILLLMLIGLAIGPAFHIVTPADFGKIGPIFTTITLIVILFESGTSISIRNLLHAFLDTFLLTFLNFVVTTIFVAVLTYMMTGYGWTISIMFGSIVGGTSSAVVIPTVQNMTMQEKSKTILILESALSDVLCIVVALALLEAIKIGKVDGQVLTVNMLLSFAIAAVIGIGAGVAWSFLINRIRTIQNSILTTPFFVFVIYGLVEMWGYSGAIASLAFGIVLGNMDLLNFFKRIFRFEPVPLIDMEKRFFAEVAFLLKTFFFIYVGISIQMTNTHYILAGLLLTVIIFLSRIPVVWSSVSRETPVPDVSLMAVMTPKGLAAAVLASMPLQHGSSGGEFIQNVTYSIVLFTIVLTSIMIFLLSNTSVAKLYTRIFSSFGRIQADKESIEYIEDHYCPE